jgi:hypothetical protein
LLTYPFSARFPLNLSASQTERFAANTLSQ